MSRQVRGRDGREWTLRTAMEWRKPATANDFEHDVAGGQVAAAIMLVVVFIFAVVLVGWLTLWRPDVLILPYWVPLLLLLFALFFPTRWVLRRPWKVVAETDGDDIEHLPAEKWVGTVRGMLKVRGELGELKRQIKQHSQPREEGALRPVD
jgi:Mg2+/Co2+ transporter CorB